MGPVLGAAPSPESAGPDTPLSRFHPPGKGGCASQSCTVHGTHPTTHRSLEGAERKRGSTLARIWEGQIRAGSLAPPGGSIPHRR
mmetsp:Transcript_16858/g.45725  ORF Transcript_16858/g.45725 Transcript_16858/m.45725 type:complete len:85 (+) Transcript_16858:234-488(+)